jgi:hypothetical protein
MHKVRDTVYREHDNTKQNLILAHGETSSVVVVTGGDCHQ